MKANNQEGEKANLKNLSTEELKHLLSKVEHHHDILQAKNEQLTIQIADLRNAVKCVQSERRENVTYAMQKKKQLEGKIDTLEKGLKYATKNHSNQTVQDFKELMK